MVGVVRSVHGLASVERPSRRETSGRYEPICTRTIAGLVAAALLFLALLFSRLSHPLLWNDEAETAVYGDRILDYGYPKVHDGRNVVYELPVPLEVGVKKECDAYIGSTWGQYYFAAPGAAWARATDDPSEKTLRMRLPFALAGATGVGLMAGLLAILLRRRVLLSLRAVAAFLVIQATSVSLLLHLREARYYPLTTLLVAACLFLRLSFLDPSSRRWSRPAAIGLALLLALLFNVFSPAWFALAGALGINALLRARTAPPALRTWTLVRGLLPIAGSAVLLVPGLVFFDTLRTTQRIVGELPHRQYFLNLLGSVFFFARYDFLLPAALVKIFLVRWRRLVPTERRTAGVRDQLEASDLLIFALGIHLLVVTRVPYLFERYLVVLSPLIGVMLVLDVVSVTDLIRVGVSEPEQLRPRRILVLIVTIGLALIAPWRVPEVGGHIKALFTPYRGPMDFAVEWIRARWADPSRLVIATNYESLVLMWYLGSRVIGGSGNYDIGADRGLVPDVVIPRPYDARAAVLEEFLNRHRYEGERLPVANLPYNNSPELSIGPGLYLVHQFRTPRPSPRYPALVIYYRIDHPEPGPAHHSYP